MTRPGVTGGEKLAALLTRMERLATLDVAVGVQGTEARLTDRDDPAVTVLDKAVRNEFGERHKGGGWRVPPRPFLRSALDLNRRKWRDFARRAAKAVAVGRLTPEVAGLRIGNTLRGDVQTRIEELDTPPNAPLTVKIKGSSNPLIDTGQLRQSIRFRATLDDEEIGVG